MAKRESLYHRFPDYRVDLEPGAGRVCIRFNGEIIAESEDTAVVCETKHDPVVYFPRRDVRFEWLEKTDHETFCPFKGEASYWTIRVGDRAEENAVWGYEAPFHQVTELADYVTFYPDRVEWDPGS